MVPGTRFYGLSLACANAWEVVIFFVKREIYRRFLSRNLHRLIIRAKRIVPAIKRVKEWVQKTRRNFVQMSLWRLPEKSRIRGIQR